MLKISKEKVISLLLTSTRLSFSRKLLLAWPLLSPHFRVIFAEQGWLNRAFKVRLRRLIAFNLQRPRRLSASMWTSMMTLTADWFLDQWRS